MSFFRAAIFDLDGVIADTARAHFLAWKAIADQLCIPFDEVANEALKGIDRAGSLDRILAAGDVELDAQSKAEIASRKNAIYLERVATLGPGDLLLPGAAELVAEARAAGLRCAIASASRNAPLVLERAGLASAFDHIADPAGLRPKPAPDLFLDAAAGVGVEPAQCVAFEDAAAGIAAIRAAGMRAIGIGPRETLREADQVYATTAAVNLDQVLADPPI